MVITKVYRRLQKNISTILLKRKNGVTVKGNIIVTGIPHVLLRGGTITIGNNVLLNSRSFGYHINMHSPVKLATSKPEAKIIIGENSRIHGTCIHAYERIEIGKNCLIAANCQIIDSNRHELDFKNPENRLKNSDKSKPVFIHDNVWIGANSIILPGVTIGEGGVVAAGSIVTKDVPPFTLVGGNPAKIIKSAITNEATPVN